MKTMMMMMMMMMMMNFDAFVRGRLKSSWMMMKKKKRRKSTSICSSESLESREKSMPFYNRRARAH